MLIYIYDIYIYMIYVMMCIYIYFRYMYKAFTHTFDMFTYAHRKIVCQALPGRQLALAHQWELRGRRSTVVGLRSLKWLGSSRILPSKKCEIMPFHHLIIFNIYNDIMRFDHLKWGYNGSFHDTTIKNGEIVVRYCGILGIYWRGI